MDNRERVINNLIILRTWAVVNPQYGLGLDMDDCRKAAQWLDEALALLETRHDSADDWISAADCKPAETRTMQEPDKNAPDGYTCYTESGPVLGYTSRGEYVIAQACGGTLDVYTDLCDPGTVTHWMPLPGKPKEAQIEKP